MIEYQALTELYLYNTQTRKKDEHGELALANMTIPTTGNNYYRVLAHDEPANDAREPADGTKYNKLFSVDFPRYYEPRKKKKANNLVAATKENNNKAFAQIQANDETTNNKKVGFAPT